MGVQFDDRAKEKKFLAYYWDKTRSKKVNIGMFATLDEANAAVEAKYVELNLPRPKPKEKKEKVENKVNLKFGMVKQ